MNIISVDEAQNMFGAIKTFEQTVINVQLNILNHLEQFQLYENVVVKAAKSYCKDGSIEIYKRWNVFKKSPKKKHFDYSKIPSKDFVPIQLNCEEIGLKRHGVFNVVNQLDAWSDAIYKKNKNAWEDKLTEEIVNAYKEYYMQHYIGSWIYNW